jgi:hypothetical protein
LLLGIILIAGAYATQHFSIKKHFKFSYQHYGVHVSFIALLAGYFLYYDSFAAFFWVMGIALLAVFIYRDSSKNKLFYFILLVILYSYIAISSLAVRFFISLADSGIIYLAPMYFMGSAIALIFLLINLNKKLKTA